MFNLHKVLKKRRPTTEATAAHASKLTKPTRRWRRPLKLALGSKFLLGSKFIIGAKAMFAAHDPEYGHASHDQTTELLLEMEAWSESDPRWDFEGRLAAAECSMRGGISRQMLVVIYGEEIADLLKM